MSLQVRSRSAGFTMIEAVVVAAVSVIIFGALIVSFKYSLDLSNVARAKLSALSVANQRMEYFRSLPYDNIGTVLGIPSGTIPQNSTTTLNGVEFHERVLVEYVDDDADGLGAADTNAIVSDYKRVRLEYTWTMREETQSIMLVSDIVPRSVETTAGGGTIRINVLDADSSLLQGASVRLFNDIVGPVDVTRFTDANGEALFSGAATGSDYQVVVTANIAGHEYSTTQTYIATTSNPNPIVSPFSVLEADVSTLTFQIGELSDLDIYTRSAINEGIFTETFTDLSAAASSSAVAASGGALVLRDTAGSYDAAGYFFLGPITPIPLLAWETLRVTGEKPANTTYRVQFYTGAAPGPFVLIPDSDLPGNSLGFDGIVDLSSLESLSYPSVFVGVTLETADTTVTPTVDEVSVFYRESETILPNAAFSMHGNKVIGTDASAQPIYKIDAGSLQTDGSGLYATTSLEFDNYTLSFTGYDMAMACPAHPFVHQAGIDGELEVVLVADAAHTLRVSVVNTAGTVIPGASVRLSRAGYDVTEVTNSCGQAFFTGGVSADVDYQIEVTATGYTSGSVAAFAIDGDTTTTVTLSE